MSCLGQMRSVGFRAWIFGRSRYRPLAEEPTVNKDNVFMGDRAARDSYKQQGQVRTERSTWQDRPPS